MKLVESWKLESVVDKGGKKKKDLKKNNCKT